MMSQGQSYWRRFGDGFLVGVLATAAAWWVEYHSDGWGRRLGNVAQLFLGRFGYRVIEEGHDTASAYKDFGRSGRVDWFPSAADVAAAGVDPKPVEVSESHSVETVFQNGEIGVVGFDDVIAGVNNKASHGGSFDSVVEPAVTGLDTTVTSRRGAAFDSGAAPAGVEQCPAMCPRNKGAMGTLLLVNPYRCLGVVGHKGTHFWHKGFTKNGSQLGWVEW